MTLPVALSGTDVIGQAKTGTGKTLGFGLPLLERVTVPADVEAGRAKPEQLTDAPQALVVVPTRELCTQVTNDLLTAGKVRNVRVLAIYGGRAYEPQVEALRKGVDVIVGTPGRLLDLAGQKKLDLKHIRSLVLDEADEMLDLGFLPDVEKIINFLPAKRQTMLFSATMPGAVIGLARRYMTQPTHIRATSPDDEGATVANTKQFIYRAHNMDKPELVARILQAEGRGPVMVFCRTKRTAADLADQLQQRGFASGAVHGDLGQGAREQALRAFRNGKVDVLVCTDVAARGIDVEGVTHVINYQSPEDEKTYLHRIGRTGRAGAKGIAVTLVDWDDIPRWQLINKALDLGFPNPPETYSTSPHFFEEMNIPAGTKGVLPRSERTRAGLAAEEVEDLGETGGRGGPRGRGGRDGGRGGRDSGRGGRDAGRDTRNESRSGAGPVDAERPARTPRRRRRTRNGAPMEGTSAATAVTSSTPEETALAPSEESAGRTPRRRRRRNVATGEQQLPATAVTAAPVSEVAESAVTTAEGPDLDAPTASRRRRTRKSAEPAVAVAEAVTPVAEAAAVVTPVAETPVEESRPRRRTRKAAQAVQVAEPVEAADETAETAAVAALDTAEAVEAKPRRTRARKTTAPAEAVEVVETVEAVEVTAPRRRTRKAVAEIPAQVVEEQGTAAEVTPRRRTRKVAEPVEVVETPVVAETKPRRTRKTAAPAEVVAVDTAEAVEAKPRRTRKAAVAAVDTAEGVEAKPRRTRKTAAAAVATEAPAEVVVEAKPRRTRKAAVAPEVVVDTVEAVESKPRRTRKTAAAVATEAPAEVEAKPRRTRKAAVDTAEGVEAKPRRTRKTAAAAVATAEIPAQAAEESEVKPRRRTTRKAAEAPVVVETAEAPEAKPRVRRPRKTAAPAVAEAAEG
ncbi:DEAD/DEAH box helicase [Streptomyces sp. MBT65]|uniref:DEAD/DEAH box helicase n=1 Tax=Streptomyces sp. MBT65 TaxID=1488395 RepID=UPI001909C4A2|nr:DEAD/DEAH box helicase [Streptomyces sp. MBT65]MBK3580739.1 DEAD/DEAH box helicase [Streptomyces sp. MBT65]